MPLHDFYCKSCVEWFEAFSDYSEIINRVMPLRHARCGEICEQTWKPGTRIAVKSQESIPRELKREFLRSEGFVPASRGEMDRYLDERGLHFEDESWCNRNLHPDRIQADRLPPETDDPEKVREWNREHYGEEYVRKMDEQSRQEFDMFSAGVPIEEISGTGAKPATADVETVTEQLASSDPSAEVSWGLDKNFNRVIPLTTAVPQGASTT